ncbi:helix-turn-helix domain-containing protein [bacterium]
MLGDRIKKYRKQLGLSQEKLAMKSEVSYTALIKIEQGKAKQPTIQTIMKLAEALDISIDELVGRKTKNV